MTSIKLPLSHLLSMLRHNWKDDLCRWIAWKLPRRLVYWCAIRVDAHATTGKFGNQVVPELLAMDALKRWNQDNTDHNTPADISNIPTEATSRG